MTSHLWSGVRKSKIPPPPLLATRLGEIIGGHSKITNSIHTQNDPHSWMRVIHWEWEFVEWGCDLNATHSMQAIQIQWASSVMLVMAEGWWSKPHRELWEVARHQTSQKFPMRLWPYICMQRCPCATHFAFSKKIQVSLFLGRREEGEGVVHTDVSGDSRTEKEQRKFHETFLIFLKKTNNGENVALSNFDSTLGFMCVKLQKPPSSTDSVVIASWYMGSSLHWWPTNKKILDFFFLPFQILTFVWNEIEKHKISAATVL